MTPDAAYCPDCGTPEMMIDLEHRALYCMNCKWSEVYDDLDEGSTHA